jgi:hypothetical protein
VKRLRAILSAADEAWTLLPLPAKIGVAIFEVAWLGQLYILARMIAG